MVCDMEAPVRSGCTCTLELRQEEQAQRCLSFGVWRLSVRWEGVGANSSWSSVSLPKPKSDKSFSLLLKACPCRICDAAIAATTWSGTLECSSCRNAWKSLATSVLASYKYDMGLQWYICRSPLSIHIFI